MNLAQMERDVAGKVASGKKVVVSIKSVLNAMNL